MSPEDRSCDHYNRTLEYAFERCVGGRTSKKAHYSIDRKYHLDEEDDLLGLASPYVVRRGSKERRMRGMADQSFKSAGEATAGKRDATIGTLRHIQHTTGLSQYHVSIIPVTVSKPSPRHPWC